MRRCGCLRRWVGRSGALGPSARRQQGVSSRARRSCELCAQAPPGLFMPPRARGRPLGERGSHWPRRPLAPAPRLPAPPRQAGEDPPPALAAGVTNARFPARGPIQPAGPATLPRSSAEPGGAGAGSRGPETGCRAAPPPQKVRRKPLPQDPRVRFLLLQRSLLTGGGVELGSALLGPHWPYPAPAQSVFQNVQPRMSPSNHPTFRSSSLEPEAFRTLLCTGALGSPPQCQV